jgi:phage shock protein A
MNLIRRISASFTTSVDRAVSRVENHDAIINAALRDTQLAASRARVRLDRLQKDGERLKARQDELETTIQRWTDRATQYASTDEIRALECLRRRRECESERVTLQAAIETHNSFEARIADQVKQIDIRIREVTQQRNVMRSRQSVADAMLALRSIEDSACGDVEDTFDRWEIKLGESEYPLTYATTVDTFDAELRAEEDYADLRAELDALQCRTTEGRS